MGSRAQVKVLDGDDAVYLYTHWGSQEVELTMRDAMAKKWRWDDPEYLARVIFDTMTKDCHNEETGYGIGACQHVDLDVLVVVDVGKQEVSFEPQFRGGSGRTYTFEEIAVGEHMGREYPNVAQEGS